jgi:hypothetical protein
MAVGNVWLDSCVHVVLSYTMALSGEHRAFVVEELIQNGGSPRHISTFQTQSANKISGTGATITLGNFTNGHSTDQGYCVVCHF